MLDPRTPYICRIVDDYEKALTLPLTPKLTKMDCYAIRTLSEGIC